jgi:glycosyltransferase involved in cell wall biosynthesis
VRRLLARFFGQNRRKVIAVFALTRAEAERAVRHALTSGSELPVWVWCVEERRAYTIPVDELGHMWCALSVVAWTGTRGGLLLKLFPFLIPPFRVLVMNEAGDFFPGRPGPIAKHAVRRIQDGFLSVIRRLRDWSGGLRDCSRSLEYRAGERLGDAAHWAQEALLAMLAVPAQLTPPLARFAITRLRKRRPVSTRFDDAKDSRFVEVVIPDRGWPRARVMRALRREDVSFVVFRRRSETDSPGWLIGIARETNAFAVAKQAAHSNWRKRVVSRHPFRRLQPNEVSQVFAPISSMLVLRRETLVRLGCPRAATCGAALALIFWRSASAGLRTLIAGHAGEITDEPAMALEDAELALRVTLSRDLRAQGPRYPARYRGNVAWSPQHSRGFRGKPRVLVVSPYLPFPLSHGGAVRIYNLCRAMAGEIDFVLACFREAGEVVKYPELHEVFREVYVVDADEKYFDPAVPARVAEYRNTAMTDLLRTQCAERGIDLVQLEYTQLAEYRDATGAVPVLLVEHDITFTLFRQIADLNGDENSRVEYQRWLEFEREALQCSNAVWTMSEVDRRVAIEHGALARRAQVIPNGVDLDRYRPVEGTGMRPSVLFVGSFRHLPNLLAFETLRCTIMPGVWRQCPDAILKVIAGPHYERAAESAGKADLLEPDCRIAIEGFVEDVRPAYAEAGVVVVPLEVSAGTNIKVMEAMACGRAVVSTPVGCHGLDLVDGRDLVIADAGPGFANAIVALLRDDDLRRRIGVEARATAERRFGWDAIAREALRSYASLIEVRDAAGRRVLPA